MPYLVRRGEPYATKTSRLIYDYCHLEKVLFHLQQQWPLTWSLAHLISFLYGGYLAASQSDPHSFNFIFSDDLVTRISAVLPALACRCSTHKSVYIWLLVLTLGLLAGWNSTSCRLDEPVAVAESPLSPAAYRKWEGAAAVRITGWSKSYSGGYWAVPAVLIQSATNQNSNNKIEPATGDGIMLSGTGAEPAPGAVLTGILHLKIAPSGQVPGSFDYNCFLAGRSLVWLGKIKQYTLHDTGLLSHFGTRCLSPIRKEILGQLQQSLPPAEAAMMGAVLLGSRTKTSKEVSGAFNDLGMAHLFAVSGLHVGILLAIVMLPGRLLKLSPTAQAFPVVMFLPWYITLTGMPGSVIRAAGLGVMILLAKPLGRRFDALYGLGFLFWAGTIWTPGQVLDAGVRLSYFAAGGILAIRPVLVPGGRINRGRWTGWMASGLFVSLIAQWFTLSQVAASFGKQSILSPFANLVGVPVFGISVWLVVISLILRTVSSWLADTIMSVGWLLLRALTGLAQLATNKTGGWLYGLPVPGPIKVLCLGLLTIVVLKLLRRPNSGWLNDRLIVFVVLIVMLVGFLVVAPFDAERNNNLVVWQFAVGQGDCSLIIFPDGWTAVIDTGGGKISRSVLGRDILQLLQRQNINNIDAVLLTHGHQDHTAGSQDLARTTNIGHWYIGGSARKAVPDQVDSLKVSRLHAGTVLHRFEEWEMVTLFPTMSQHIGLHENDQSLVVALYRAGEPLMLFSGDLETEGEELMLAGGSVPAGVQVWKAGHHGSKTSGSQKFVAKMSPDLILISCGIENSYRHPSHGLYLLGADTIPVIRTDLDGTIRLIWATTGGPEVEYGFNRLIRRQ